MKRIALGALLFVFILGFFIMQNNMELAMNITGIIGLGGILIGGFLKTGFVNPNAPVIGNLAVIKLDKKMDLSNTILLIALPNIIGSLLMFFYTR